MQVIKADCLVPLSMGQMSSQLSQRAAKQCFITAATVALQYLILCDWSGFVALLWSKNGG